MSSGGRFLVVFTVLCEEYDHDNCVWPMYMAECCQYLYVDDRVLYFCSDRSVM